MFTELTMLSGGQAVRGWNMWLENLVFQAKIIIWALEDLERRSLKSGSWGQIFKKIVKSKWIDLEAQKIFWPLVFFIAKFDAWSYRKKLSGVYSSFRNAWKQRGFYFVTKFPGSLYKPTRGWWSNSLISGVFCVRIDFRRIPTILKVMRNH